eukprot:3905584-Pleurochrysis_carterae.AAC.1
MAYAQRPCAAVRPRARSRARQHAERAWRCPPPPVIACSTGSGGTGRPRALACRVLNFTAA